MVENLTVELKEYGTASPDSHPQLRNLFIRPENEDLVGRLAEGRALEVREGRFGLHLQAGSYVGRIRIGPLQVVIRPKLNWTDLHVLVAYAYGLPDLRHYPSVSEHPIREASLRDVIIDHLATLTEELVRRGLARQYAQRHEYLTSPRGRIDLAAIARDGGITRPALPSFHYLRLNDWRLNQVLLSGLNLASSVTDNVELKRTVNRLARLIGESVSPVPFHRFVRDRAESELNRLTIFYEIPLKLIGIIADMCGWAPNDGTGSVPLPGYLVDMNRFFQMLLLRLLRDNLPSFKIESERGFSGIISYTLNPRHRQRPVPRPDFIVSSKGRIAAVLDAKYRDLWNPEPPPREWLYHLALYASSIGPTRTATILYATQSQFAREERAEVRELSGSNGIAQIIIRPVNLSRLAALVTDNSPLARKSRRAWAQALALDNPGVSYRPRPRRRLQAEDPRFSRLNPNAFIGRVMPIGTWRASVQRIRSPFLQQGLGAEGVRAPKEPGRGGEEIGIVRELSRTVRETTLGILVATPIANLLCAGQPGSDGRY